MEVEQYFLRELKERGLINVKWISGEAMTSDMFTKNLAGPLLDKHAQSFVGRDAEMEKAGDVEKAEEPEIVIPKGRVSEYLESQSGPNKGTRMWNQPSAGNSARKVNGRDDRRGSVSNSADSASNSARDKINKKSENNLQEHDRHRKKLDQKSLGKDRNQRKGNKMNLGQNRNQGKREEITTNNRNHGSTMKGESVRNSARENDDSARNVIKKEENGTRNRSEMYRRPE